MWGLLLVFFAILNKCFWFAWNVTYKCYVTGWERVGPGNYFDNVGNAFCAVRSNFQPRSQGPLSTSRKYPGYGWSRVYACQPKPHRGWVLNLILSTLSREVNVSLLYRHLLFWKGSKLFVRDPAWPAALALPEPLWVWDVDWQGTLLIFHCFFK